MTELSLKFMDQLKNWTLFRHLAIAFAATLTVMIMTTGWWARSQAKAYLDQSHREQVIQIYSAIASTTLEAVMTEDRGVLNDLIDRIIRLDPNILSVVVMNEEDYILAEWSQDGVVGTEEVTSFSHDFIYLGEHFGSMEFQRSSQADSQAIDAHVLTLQKILALSLFIMAASITLWIYWLLIKPIIKVSEHLNGFRRGKQQTPLMISFPQEIARLSKAVNQLGNFLLTQKDREQELERQVQQRTLELTYQAQHDPLTGLYNRTEFEQCLKQLMVQAKSLSSTHALLYIDLDQFKLVNDTCGHIAGDQLLKQLSETLQLHIRQSDCFARVGGDEFTLLAKDCNLDNAQRIASKILESIRGFRFAWGNHVFDLGASIGIAAITPHDQFPEDILRHADIACYMAKELGRNRIQVFQENDNELQSRHKEMQQISRIHKAIEENRLVLYFQAITPVDPTQFDGKHFEILVRMINSDGTITPPGGFLPAAERFNLMADIDRFIISTTLSFLGQAQVNVDQVSLCSINISGQSLGEDGFLDFLVHQVSNLSFPTHKLCFEITETAAISNITKVKTVMTKIQKMGCRFALDDFGTGMSSYAYLKHLPVDYLKIDGSFVKNMATDSVDHIMVASINEIGHALGIQTIAEFVEDNATLQALQSLGVDFAQGFFIDKPRPLSQLGLSQDASAIKPIFDNLLTAADQTLVPMTDSTC